MSYEDVCPPGVFFFVLAGCVHHLILKLALLLGFSHSSLYLL